MKARRQLAAVVVFAAPILASCGGQAADKLYSREGSFEVTSMTQLDAAVLSISRAAGAPVRDSGKDLDGNPQYLLSNKDVVIFVRHHFGDDCVLPKGCRWEYSVSATDTELHENEQERLVNAAFAMITSANP